MSKCLRYLEEEDPDSHNCFIVDSKLTSGIYNDRDKRDNT